MSKDVCGIPLTSFQDPIYTALAGYAELSQGRVSFDRDAAVQLERTTRDVKPNSARSVSTVTHLGKVAGDLYVIVFAPGDGTGDENTYKLAALNTGMYPRDAKVVPRSKAAAHTEGHLTIASFNLDRPGADPALFAGNQKLLGLGLGLSDHVVVELGQLGQNPVFYQQALAGVGMAAPPSTTLTTGFSREGKRFGDPHAVYNPYPEAVQVCGFLALTPEAAREHSQLFFSLRALEPLLP